MFDLAWSEIGLIAVVALVVIGPKDLPEAVRGLARGVQKLRRMAGEFQGHVDEMVREANLDEVRQQINEVRNFNIRDHIEKAVDADGSIRKTFNENPLHDSFAAPPAAHTPGGSYAGAGGFDATAPLPSAPPEGAAPAFIPPQDAVAAAPPVPTAPAVIPPQDVAAAVPPPPTAVPAEPSRAA